MRTNSYRRMIAAGLLAVAVSACAPVGSTQAQRPTPARPTTSRAWTPQLYDRTCPTPAEDSPIPATCHLNPKARYDYSNGAWRVVADDMTYANGNRPPLGSELSSRKDD